MSGSVSANYYVVSNAELERRALQAARIAADAAQEQVRRLRAAVAEAQSVNAGYVIDISVVTPAINLTTASRNELTAWTVETSGLVAKAESELSARVAAVRMARMLSSLSTGSTSSTAAPRLTEAQPAQAPASKAKPAATGGDDQSGGSRHKAETRVRTILDQLRGDVDDAEAKALEDLARRAVVAGTDAGRSALCTELRVQVRAVNSAAQRRLEDVREATELIAGLDGLDGPDVSAAVSVLRVVQTGQTPLTADLRRQAQTAAAHRKAEADQVYAAAVLAGAFGELGYDIEVGFETLAGTNGGAYATRWPGHSVKVELTAAGQLSASLVREGSEPGSPSELEAELELERSFCRDIALATVTLESQDIVTEITHQVRAGDQALAAAEASRAERARLNHQRQRNARRATPRAQRQR